MNFSHSVRYRTYFMIPFCMAVASGIAGAKNVSDIGSAQWIVIAAIAVGAGYSGIKGFLDQTQPEEKK